MNQYRWFSRNVPGFFSFLGNEDYCFSRNLSSVLGVGKDKIYLKKCSVIIIISGFLDFSHVEPYNITTIVRGLDYEKKNTSRIHQ